MKLSHLSSILITSCALLSAPLTWAKSAVSYDYAGIQYLSQNLDDADCSQDGLNIYGSMELNSDFFAIGSLADVGGSKNCGSSTLSLGAGYQELFGADSSIYGTLSYENTSVDHGHSDSGLVAAVGLRGFFQPNLEAKIELAHHTAFDGNTVINGGLVYWFQSNLAATGDLSLGSDTSGIAVGLRMSF
jgi:hypothetical protein